MLTVCHVPVAVPVVSAPLQAAPLVTGTVGTAITPIHRPHQTRVREWQRGYWERAMQAGIPVQAQFDDFLRASDLMGVQRHLKVIGIFARICHRDGKPRYLDYIPRVWALLERDLTHPALEPVAAWFDANIPAEYRAAGGGRFEV